MGSAYQRADEENTDNVRVMKIMQLYEEEK